MLRHMPSSSAPELRVNTSEIVRDVVEGESFIIERRAIPVAELTPITHQPRPLMPDREAFIMASPETLDSGLILEQDRT